MKFLNQTNWMWSSIGDNSPDIYRLFRKEFVFVPGTEQVLLEIAVCSTFELQINGKVLKGQQLSDFPDSPTGGCFDVTDMLLEGKNQLLLQVHYIGEDFLTGLTGKPFVKIALYRGNELLLSDVIGTEEDTVGRDLERSEDERTIRSAVSELEERERMIIELRYGLSGGEERTQKEVADLLGISQSYISRLEKKIIHRLREKIETKI